MGKFTQTSNIVLCLLNLDSEKIRAGIQWVIQTWGILDLVTFGLRLKS